MFKISRPRIFYGYIIVIASVLILFVMHGIGVAFGIFFKTWQLEFGWSRTVISGAASLGAIVGGICGIASGKLSDKFGPRIILVASAVILGSGYILMSRLQNIWQLYLFVGVIAAIGSSSGDISTLSTTARWFVKKRGLMSGIVKAGTGMGMLFMPLIVNWLYSSNGWRNSYIILGIICITCISLFAQFLKRDPGQYGIEPYGRHEQHIDSIKLMETGFSVQEAIHTKQFWMVCAIYILIWYCANSIVTHIVPHALDIGLSPITAASTVSVIGGASIIGRLTMGSTGDRISNRRSLILCFIIYISALCWLQFVREMWMIYLFAGVYGFAHGGFFALPSPLVAELFGTKSHGAIFGIIIFFGTIGGAIGPTVAGLIFDLTQSYFLAFLILIAVNVAGFILSIFLRPTESMGNKVLRELT